MFKKPRNSFVASFELQYVKVLRYWVETIAAFTLLVLLYDREFDYSSMDIEGFYIPGIILMCLMQTGIKAYRTLINTENRKEEKCMNASGMLFGFVLGLIILIGSKDLLLTFNITTFIRVYSRYLVSVFIFSASIRISEILQK